MNLRIRSLYQTVAELNVAIPRVKSISHAKRLRPHHPGLGIRLPTDTMSAFLVDLPRTRPRHVWPELLMARPRMSSRRLTTRFFFLPLRFLPLAGRLRPALEGPARVSY